MSTMRLTTTTESERDAAVEAATLAVNQGQLVVIPTDTVYGIGADAFAPEAVAGLLAAKGRGREMPPPVLVSSALTLDALAADVPEWARALVTEFWPGPLTLVCHQQPSLQWDLGETHGTVAVRMPDHEVALAVLERTGPLAVSSANLSGRLAALDVDEAEEMLGEKVQVYVDAGRTPGSEASTIVDVTGERCHVLRLGVVSLDRLRAVLDPWGVTLSGEGVSGGEGASGEEASAVEAPTDDDGRA
ncbi:threonylcarbamoyl-AMP synthase [Nocardioides sp. Y6]|uniref:L-threonylcarbamoyladenylate synthase n=1 Tax=Nocardioides malaquae TaxID=2773426 RepID=A0ABR9RPY0_9ACTN|nr:L-threonylcarbamoyladenylate synthase [Nocardioides malaquae]MBE7323624.1 threonylcarbamoyl-AMP synthase [Nocardioides malaquae]